MVSLSSLQGPGIGAGMDLGVGGVGGWGEYNVSVVDFWVQEKLF